MSGQRQSGFCQVPEWWHYTSTGRKEERERNVFFTEWHVSFWKPFRERDLNARANRWWAHFRESFFLLTAERESHRHTGFAKEDTKSWSPVVRCNPSSRENIYPKRREKKAHVPTTARKTRDCAPFSLSLTCVCLPTCTHTTLQAILVSALLGLLLLYSPL